MLQLNKRILLGVIALGLLCCKSDLEVKQASSPQQVVVKPKVKSTNSAETNTTVSNGVTKNVLKNKLQNEATLAQSPADIQAISDLSSKETPKAEKKPAVSKRKAKPAIKFDKIRYDFGTIMQGDTVDVKFAFTNTGSAPLVINSTNVTCGCTRASYPFIPVETGEEGYVGVRYLSVGKEGLQKPVITVYSNASKEPISLMMSGNVMVEKPQLVDSTINDSLKVEIRKDSLILDK